MTTRDWILGIPLILLIVFWGADMTIRYVAPEFPKWPDPYMPRVVTGETFINETIPLDGVQYDHCKFENPKFIYNGTTPLRFSNNKVDGKTILTSDNPAIDGAWLLMVGFGVVKNIELYNLPKNSIVEPPSPKPE